MLPVTAAPWPVIWARALRSHQDVARQNALTAARVLAERRREREDVERYLEDRARHDRARRGSGAAS
jgi:hypothetical protein